MNKLKLELDALRVESFDTNGTGASGGTVRGNEWTPYGQSYLDPCFGNTDEPLCATQGCSGVTCDVGCEILPATDVNCETQSPSCGYSCLHTGCCEGSYASACYPNAYVCQ